MRELVPVRLKAELKRRGMTYADVARAAGMQQGNVAQIATGRLIPYERQINKIAAAIGWEGEPSELLEECAE